LSAFSDDHLESLVDGFCYKLAEDQLRNELWFLPNQLLPFSGENICIYSEEYLKTQQLVKGVIMENGQFHSQGEIINGKQEGSWTQWHDNGKKHVERNYKDGDLLSETFYKYYKNGQIDSKKNYKDKKLNGKSTFWYDNGQKFFEGHYKDHKADSKWTFWKKSGLKEEERNYKDGEVVDRIIFKYSYFTGRLKSEINYKDGKCINGEC